jgi:hypothetical protein
VIGIGREVDGIGNEGTGGVWCEGKYEQEVTCRE